MIKNLTPTEAVELLKENNTRLIDVRESWEFEIARVEGSELMPMSNFYRHMQALRQDENLLIICHHGVRSLSICALLIDNNFKNVINLEGGIEAWSQQVDPSIPLY
ncbi:MAG: hypothetical protein K8H86_13405 [Ignavibacteriaceae bacterium]|nr:hypothetical protein [Ignavibacteriaceae bacterium]